MYAEELTTHLISDCEGFSPKPYFATKEEERRRLLTIGYGFTTLNGQPVRITDHLDHEQGLKLLIREVEHFISRIKTLVPNRPDNEYAAVCSLVFNIGWRSFTASTLLKKWKSEDIPGAANEFSKWIYQDKKIVNGLVVRRGVEKKLFLTGTY